MPHNKPHNCKQLEVDVFWLFHHHPKCFALLCFFQTICLRSLNQSAKQDKTIEGRLYSASVIKSVHLNLVLLFVVHCFFFLAVTKPDTVTQFSVCGAAQLLYCELSSKSLAQSWSVCRNVLSYLQINEHKKENNQTSSKTDSSVCKV